MGWKGLFLAFLLTASSVAHAAQPAQGAHRATATGRLTLTFRDRSPLTDLEKLSERIEEGFHHLTPSEAVHREYDLATESYDVYVPPSYRPDVPHGLIVWMGVTEYSPEWLELLAKHNLIWITANNTGGRSWIARQGLAIDAAYNMGRNYNIDSSRVYIAGFSAGGQMSVVMLRLFPEVFNGGIFMMGGYFYASYWEEKERGPREPTVLAATPPWHAPVEQLKSRVKIVMLKGEDDPTSWTEFEGQSDYESLTLDGFTRVSLFILPKWGHMHPKNDYFEKALDALEKQPTKPPTTAPTKNRFLQPGQIAQAKRLLMSARFLLDPPTPPSLPKYKMSAKDRDRGRVYLQQVLDDFPTSPTAPQARQILEKLGRATTQPHATGRLALTFDERSPLSAVEEVSGRGPFAATATSQPSERDKYELEKESFEVFVPPTYRANVPHGILVWINPGGAELPAGWMDVLGKQKLIWIAPNNVANWRSNLVRAGLALDGLHNLKQLYNVNEDRVFIAGFGGGGEVASLLVAAYPEEFDGGVFMMGSAVPAKWEGELAKLKKELRLVFMGSDDRRNERANYDSLRRDGFERVRFIEGPRGGKTVPDGKWLEKGIQALGR